MLWGVVGKPRGSMKWIAEHISAARSDAVQRLGAAAWVGAWRCFEHEVRVDGDWLPTAVGAEARSTADCFLGRQGPLLPLLRPLHLVPP